MIDREFRRGFVKLYSLWRAAQSEVHGLQIIAEMRDLGFKIGPGTLYPTLHALLEERDVKVANRLTNGRIRKCYRATPKGKREAKEVVERLSVVLRAMK
jgi:PadR family transcriptional regulator, regulatory protein PadR